MRVLGGILVLLAISDARASEIVRVRVFSTAQQKIEIYDNHKLSQIIKKEDIKAPVEIKGDSLRINAQIMPPHIILHPRNNNVDVIAVLNMEEYLKGVLPHEMPLVWPLEALKAQAIVARSFTLRQIEARKDNPYHLDSTVNDQMYKYGSTFTAQELENLTRALEQTKDEILETQSGSTVRALYHADCGGQTEKASKVWGQKEVEFSVKDVDHATPYSNWNFKISAEELKAKLKTGFVPHNLAVTAESLSQRAVQMEVIGLNQEREKLSSQEFRKLVGYSKLKSRRFQIQKINKDFHFKGSGFGHGVGLCQWGARAWARTGKNYKEILKHYFPSYSLITKR